MRGKFSVVYQKSHDIDWFARKGNVMIHAMSFGGLLPQSVNYWIANLNMLRRAYRIPISNQEIVYSDYFEVLLRENQESEQIDRERYLQHFTEMAKRGFWSFDRDLNNEDVYHLIARPARMVSVKEMMRGLPELTDAVIQVHTMDDGSITDVTMIISREL